MRLLRSGALTLDVGIAAPLSVVEVVLHKCLPMGHDAKKLEIDSEGPIQVR